MTRSDVKKLAWTLRLVGYGLLGGAATLMLLGASHASQAPAGAGSSRPDRLVLSPGQSVQASGLSTLTPDR